MLTGMRCRTVIARDQFHRRLRIGKGSSHLSERVAGKSVGLEFNRGAASRAVLGVSFQVMAHFVCQNADGRPAIAGSPVELVDEIGIVEHVTFAAIAHGRGVLHAGSAANFKIGPPVHCIEDIGDDGLSLCHGSKIVHGHGPARVRPNGVVPADADAQLPEHLER